MKLERVCWVRDEKTLSCLEYTACRAIDQKTFSNWNILSFKKNHCHSHWSPMCLPFQNMSLYSCSSHKTSFDTKSKVQALGRSELFRKFINFGDFGRPLYPLYLYKRYQGKIWKSISEGCTVGLGVIKNCQKKTSCSGVFLCNIGFQSIFFCIFFEAQKQHRKRHISKLA